ncbi:glycosyltransferase family 4 protein [Pedobacter arcticus]|uniref:glycosyltransferase family 4 protein n=1 Tax=Pedobacter arcticus TaxID=752140 RepID=UPI0003789C10|nr:glycosyltransferase family 4 protein [Pedobacter arcticus]
MKILIFTPAFLPMVGGLENMAYMLAKEWSKAGLTVNLITYANKEEFDDDNECFTILRNPSKKTYWDMYLKSDLIFFLNMSLKGVWPTFFKKKPVFVSHQITYYNINGKISVLEQLKRQLSRRFTNISCSNFVRSTLPQKTGFVIHNSYNSDIFSTVIEFDNRLKDLVFVGRLVSDKGLDTLIKALAIIKSENGKTINLDIIGDGPEYENLRTLSCVLGISSQVKFLGKIIGIELSEKINEYKTMVVPSKWKEPFGLVALEGMACGCRLVVSKHGGLVEAVGNLSKVFENGNEKSLSIAILESLNSPVFAKEKIEKHLSEHTQSYIAQEYISLFKNHIQ